jgi:hypothetical protein
MMRADTLQTTADSLNEEVSAPARARCVKEKGHRIYRSTYKATVSNCQQSCQQVSNVVLTHTREETADSSERTRRLVATFKLRLKKGPKMGRKDLALFVVQEAARHGLYGAAKTL